MSKLDDWQTQITELDAATKSYYESLPKQMTKEDMDVVYGELARARANVNWETIARQALKVALAADKLTPYLLFSGEVTAYELKRNELLNQLQDALEEIES